MTTEPAAFEVVVVGSGAAGMTAALAAAHHGLDVVVIEKTGRFGGSTARSGGGVWIPGNEVLRRAGVADTPEQASAYLAHVVDGCVSAARQRALLEHGPAMLGFVRAHTPVDFAWVPDYADYYPEAPGGLAVAANRHPGDPAVLGVQAGHRGVQPDRDLVGQQARAQARGQRLAHAEHPLAEQAGAGHPARDLDTGEYRPGVPGAQAQPAIVGLCDGHPGWGRQVGRVEVR